MTTPSSNPFTGIIIRESLDDGSDFSNPDADYRRLFLGEDGQLHVKDSAGAVTDIGSGSGAVATDAIWDAAGDLAVGSGANTAARLAIGAAGGAVSRVNGAVAWNSGTSFPTAATGDRYWRTDLGMEFYYDGTRWLSTTQYHMYFGKNDTTSISATGTVDANPAFAAQFDIWIEDFLFTYYPAAPNDGTHNWTIAIFSSPVPTGGDTTLATFTTAAATDDAWNQSVVAEDALGGTATARFYLLVTKNSSPGNIRAFCTMTYRRVAT